MTNERLREIREACDAATPGPWVAGEHYEGQNPGAYVYDQSGRVVCADECATQQPSPSEARFIALARAAVPELLDEVARMRDRMEVLRMGVRLVQSLGLTKWLLDCHHPDIVPVLRPLTDFDYRPEVWKRPSWESPEAALDAAVAALREAGLMKEE